jgi:hypothetical protein
LSRFRTVLTHHLLIAFALFTFLWLLFFWRLWTPTLADRVLFARGDFSLHYYSFSAYQVERLWQGQIPLWNPYNYGGDPFAANVQWVTWYPPRLIAALVAGQGNWSIESLQWEVAVHYWLVNWMTYFFLCALVKRKSAALVGSLLFTYGGYLTGYPMLQVSVIESVAWLPLLMLGVHLSVYRDYDGVGVRPAPLKKSINGIILAALAIGLSFLAGHPQTTLQLIYCALAYLFVVGRICRLSWLELVLRAGLILALGGALAAIQLLPALEFIRLSSRSALNYADKSNGFALSDVLQMAVPTLFGTWSPLYIGAAGLLLAAGAMLRRSRMRSFWVCVVIVSLLVAFGHNTIVYDFFYVFVPGINTFRQQERVAALAVFALTVLATYHLDDLLDNKGEVSSLVYARCVQAYALLMVGAFVAFALLGLSGGTFIAADVTINALAFSALMGIFFAGWYHWQRRYGGMIRNVAAVLIALVVIDLFTIGTRSTNFVPDVPENREPPPTMIETLSVPNNIQWHVDGAGGIQGRGTYFDIPDIYGTGPFSLQSMDELRTIPVERFWEVLSVRYVTAIDEPPVDLVPMNLLAYGQNYDGAEYRVFEILNPRPFAWLVYDVRVAENNPVFARQIMSDPRVNLREIAVTTQPLPFELSGTRPEGATVDSFTMVTAERLEMSVSTSENAHLTLALANYPGWRATVNGAEVPIIDTYAGLIGVPIGAGEGQQVVVEFAPTLVYAGAAISGLALLVIIVLGVFGLGRRNKGQSGTITIY